MHLSRILGLGFAMQFYAKSSFEFRQHDERIIIDFGDIVWSNPGPKLARLNVFPCSKGIVRGEGRGRGCVIRIRELREDFGARVERRNPCVQ